MTTLSEDLTAWMAGGRGRFWEHNFDLLIVRVRELEAEVVLAKAREQAAYVSTVATYQTRLEALEAYLERQAKAHQEVQTKLRIDRDAAYENGKRVWKDAEVWFDALADTRRERNAYAKAAAEAQEHLTAVLMREQSLTEERDALNEMWSPDKALAQRQTSCIANAARRKALEDCLQILAEENEGRYSESRIHELLEREPKL